MIRIFLNSIVGILAGEGPTNVLAFPMSERSEAMNRPYVLGDIVISLDTAGREAARLGMTFEDRLDRLLVHGLLHLMNYDHEGSPREARRMQKEEERLEVLMREASL